LQAAVEQMSGFALFPESSRQAIFGDLCELGLGHPSNFIDRL